ncbi:DUF2953 domain-containing protein [Hathewaya massiliensis]|uniref:DUF2953 domain-containing protein n=1 Tax=Hathewaya massiliensis TaxID=1964382 RepID=UPI00115B4F40|nr:DUF2953 domain-containing protein [Hathewaya massiliensis]
MKYLIIIGIILCLILFFPVPLKIYILFIEKELNIYVYNFNIKNKSFKNKPIIESLSESIKSSKFKLSNIAKAKSSSSKNKKKTKLNFNISVNYSLDDAFETAIFYGIIYGSLNILLTYLSKYVILKPLVIKVTPEYNTEKLDIKIKGIIYLNLVKIIYILVKLYISSKKDKVRRT